MAWAAMAGEQGAEDEGFQSLFNGQNLDGWVVEATPAHMTHGDDRIAWSVEDGQIVCNGRGFGFLRYAERPFADFTLRADFQLPEKSNSGVGIRTRGRTAVRPNKPFGNPREAARRIRLHPESLQRRTFSERSHSGRCRQAGNTTIYDNAAIAEETSSAETAKGWK